MEYIVRRAAKVPELQGLWDGPAWRDASIADVNSFHPASSDHRPVTQAKILHAAAGLYVIFRVRDRPGAARGRHDVARQLPQVRGRILPPALGELVADRRGAEFPRAEVLRDVPV
jgi:hypothetical protein